MLKSLPVMLARLEKDEDLLGQLVETYRLDEREPLIPQIEAKLGRRTTRKENDALDVAFLLGQMGESIPAIGDFDADVETRYLKKKKKKKKKKKWPLTRKKKKK